jgi:zinc transporter ZupT
MSRPWPPPASPAEILATLWAPGRWVTSYIQHFAAGVVIAAVALQVAPDIEHSGARPLPVLAGFALGGVFMIGVKWATLRIEKRQRRIGALLYLVTEELLIETRLPEETLTSTAMFFLGFLAVFAFISLGGDWGVPAGSGPAL